MIEYNGREITGLITLQMAWGGLFDAAPVDPIHLVRQAGTATPGPILCGIDRFAADGPGWSLGGGVTDPDAAACPACAREMRINFDGLPVSGMFAALFEATS